MIYILKHSESGELSYTDMLDGCEQSEWIKLGEVPNRTPGDIGDFEEWDEQSNSFVVNTKEQEDAKAGEQHINTAHDMKYQEALLILSGVILTKGILIEESELRNITLIDLANEVYTKRQEIITKELERMGAAL